MNYIEIKDSLNQDYLSVSLHDLLNKIKFLVEKYYWSIYELTAVGNKKYDINIPELEEIILNSPTGLHLKGEELLNLAEKCDQVINLILIASLDEEGFSELENVAEWQRNYPIVIELEDGYCWNVYSQDKELIYFLASCYKDTKVHVQN
jgi:hypothetical protein